MGLDEQMWTYGFTYGFTPVCYYCRWDWTIICEPIGFTNHPSVKLIEQKSRGSEKFDFQEVNSTQVKRVPESLHANKTTGHDGISAKILKAGAQETSLSLSTTRTSKMVSGHGTGKKGTGHQSIKERTRTPRRITDL